MSFAMFSFAVFDYTDEDGALVSPGRLPAEQGAVVLKALQATSAELSTVSPPDDELSTNPSAEGSGVESEEKPGGSQRRADGLVLMAETGLLAGCEFPQHPGSLLNYAR